MTTHYSTHMGTDMAFAATLLQGGETKTILEAVVGSVAPMQSPWHRACWPVITQPATFMPPYMIWIPEAIAS